MKEIIEKLAKFENLSGVEMTDVIERIVTGRNAQEQPRPVLHRRPPPGSVPVAVRDRSAALTDLIGDPRVRRRAFFRDQRRDPTVLPRGAGGLGAVPRGAAPSALQIPRSS